MRRTLMDNRGRLRTALGSIQWAEQLVLLALCVAEASLLWIGASAVLAVPAGEPHAVRPWLVFLLIWAAAQVLRALEALDVWEPWHQIAMAVSIVVSLAVSVRIVSFSGVAWDNSQWVRETADGLVIRSSEASEPVWGVVALVAIVWWRTFFRGEPTRDAAFRLLRAGTVGILAGACALALIDRAEREVDSAASVLAFFVSALAAIGLSRFTSGDHAGRAELTARSVVTALTPAAAVLVLGVLATGVLQRDVVETVVWSLGPLLWALSVVVRVVILAIALVAVLLMTPFLLLLDGRSFQLGTIRFDGSNLQPHGVMDQASDTARAIPDPIRYLIAIAVLLILFAGVTRFALRRRKRRAAPAQTEERVRIRPLFDLSALLAALLRRLGLGEPEAADDPLDTLRNDPRWAATVRIRERYRDLLHWSAERDRPRLRGQTPNEHAILLTRGMTGEGTRNDVAIIARVYDRARYSSEPATSTDADAAQDAWRRLERLGSAGR